MEKVMPHPNYMGVWGWLLGLTILEVGALYLKNLHVPGWAVITTLLFLAVIKALLVAMYFMHLKFEKFILIAILSYPLVLSVILTMLTMLSLNHVQ